MEHQNRPEQSQEELRTAGQPARLRTLRTLDTWGKGTAEGGLGYVLTLESTRELLLSGKGRTCFKSHSCRCVTLGKTLHLSESLSQWICSLVQQRWQRRLWKAYNYVLPTRAGTQ